MFNLLEQRIDTLARALLLAPTSIEGRDAGDPDADIAALESAAAKLRQASAEEQASLVRAAPSLGVPGWLDEMGVR